MSLSSATLQAFSCLRALPLHLIQKRRTRRTRLKNLWGEDGIGYCNITKCCTEVCRFTRVYAEAHGPVHRRETLIFGSQPEETQRKTLLHEMGFHVLARDGVIHPRRSLEVLNGTSTEILFRMSERG
jgi:hypothetical protein